MDEETCVNCTLTEINTSNELHKKETHTIIRSHSPHTTVLSVWWDWPGNNN
jgi:hypothetical protein